MNITRTFDLLQQYREKFGYKEDVLAGKVKGQWKKYSVSDYSNYSNYISYGLLASGIQNGDKIATISNNRPEWNFMDMGLAQMGAVHVPVFSSLDKEGYKILLAHAEVKWVFVSDKTLAAKIAPLVNEIDTLKKIYSFDDLKGVPSWKEIVDLGQQNEEKYKEELERIKEGISPKDCVTLIYTSGTTGNPKGVMLSHENLVSNAIAAAGVFQLQPQHRYLSILPLCHVGERMGNYQSQYSGCSIYYAESLSSIAADLAEVKPHGFGAVPRLLEKVYDKIISKGNKLTGIKRKIFFWALALGLDYRTNGANGWWYELKLKFANKIFFTKWREAMGGNILSIGVGGAALQPELERVFWAAGIKLLNMYGLTETSPIITINKLHPSGLQLGSVGSVIDGVELRIAEDGEILCKGSNVMLGYFKDEKSTREAMDREGWYRTGDIGKIDEKGFLKITDRKKELFKLSNGKYVSPQTVENLFKESEFIDQLMVVGEGEKFASALISPNFEALKKWCADNNVEGRKEEWIKSAKVNSHYKNLVSTFNKRIGKDEQIRQVILVAEEWTPESGALSPTLKLKRKVLMKKYEQDIKGIFRHELETEAG